ncbi:MAG: LON peptidase substrate-binding domain-containing protein, partial [Candidatus Eisenbacteria bacterium]|nr:LON peptidase substrate-binding domain-containing protein [Candidatus Eisenbacteria bacterium]
MTDSLFPVGTEAVLPILPLRNSVLFPASVVPVNVGRSRSVRLIEEACNQERPTLGVLAQRKPETEDPTFEELHAIGTIARVLKVIRLGSGNYSVVLQGIGRMRMAEGLERHPYLQARVERLPEPLIVDPAIDLMANELRRAMTELSASLPPANRSTTSSLDNVREAGALADLVATGLPLSNDQKQAILELFDVRERLKAVLEQVKRQADVFRVKKEISALVEHEMHKSQRCLLYTSDAADEFR